MTDRRAAIRQALKVKREAEYLLRSLANSPELVDYLAAQSARQHGYVEPVSAEDGDVVAERYGVTWPGDDEGEIPAAFKERFGDHLEGRTRDPG